MDMDQFNIPHQKVKEKSVYMLHLDAARIILISAAVIGIIIVSFLLGMNFIKGGDAGFRLFVFLLTAAEFSVQCLF